MRDVGGVELGAPKGSMLGSEDGSLPGFDDLPCGASVTSTGLGWLLNDNTLALVFTDRDIGRIMINDSPDKFSLSTFSWIGLWLHSAFVRQEL